MEQTTSIEVLAKTTADNLRAKNEAFLANYPTDDNQIDYYTKLARKVFDEFEIDGTHEVEGVRKNVALWFKNKQSLMALFRKHPYWDEEAKAIVFLQDELRKVDYESARCKLADIGNYVCAKFGDGNWDRMCLGVYYTLYNLYDAGAEANDTITSDFILRFERETSDCEIPKDIKRMLKVGTKITKFTRKCFTKWTRPNGEVIDATTLVDDHEEGDRSYNSFDKLYAKFADTLSELTIKKITLVSLHFCDFMTMSNGNSWSSCHYINSNNIFHESGTSSYSGCYKQGCLSYALDKPSFLLYTLPNTYKGKEYYRQQKINRMCCQYEEGYLVTGKCYPENNKDRITRYRQIMQLILSTIEDVPNLWTFSRKVDRIEAFVKTVKGSAHYRDYESEGQKPTISMCKHRIDLDHMMTVGHIAYCLHCGESLEDTDAKYLQCARHRKKPICAKCGRHVEEGERHVINDAYYCHDCSFWCNVHNRYETIDSGKHEIRVDGVDMTVCDYALNNRFFRCARCGEWHMRKTACNCGGNSYCVNCCNTLKENGEWNPRIELIKDGWYETGDYVLLTSDIASVNQYGTNGEMQSKYANRIVKLIDFERSLWGNKSGYYVTLDGDHVDYKFSVECFVGKIIGDVSGYILGKTIEEVT